MFTARRYEAVAEVLAANSVSAHADPEFIRGLNAMRQYIACDLADLFAADNSSFDRTKFLMACKADVIL